MHRGRRDRHEDGDSRRDIDDASKRSRRMELALLRSARPRPGRAASRTPTRQGTAPGPGLVLASNAFGGRSGEGGRKTAEYLAEVFRALGLEPLFDDGYFQESRRARAARAAVMSGPGCSGPTPRFAINGSSSRPTTTTWGSRGGALPGGRRQRLGRRHDARGSAGDRPGPSGPGGAYVPRLRPGGDRPVRLALLRRAPARPPGSAGPLLDGRHDRQGVGGVCEPYVFVMGTEHSPGLRPWIEGRPAIARSRSACSGPTC